MKRTLAILFVLATSFAHAQTFFDGFENYAADSGEYVSKGGWGLYSFNDPELYSPVVRTARDGITLYEGTRMLELRCPSIGGFTECYSPFPYPSPQKSLHWISVQVALASASFEKQLVQISPDINSGLASVNILLDAANSTYLVSGGLVEHRGNLTFALDKWHQVDMLVNLSQKSTTIWFDGNELGNFDYVANKSSYITKVALKTRNTSHPEYSRMLGSPGAFFDKVTIHAVPETGILPALALGLLSGTLSNRRKRA